MKKSLKVGSLNVDNDLSTSGCLNFANGYQFMDSNTNNGLPENFQFGPSISQGNVTRNNFNTTSNGPIHFNYTQDDRKRLISKFPLIIKDFPIASKIPWLYPLPITQDWSGNTQTIIDKSSTSVPITKCLGKGLGHIDIYKVADSFQGLPEVAGKSTMQTDGITETTKNSDYYNNIIYPFDGRIYSGTLVEIITQTNQTTGISETVVVPYQSGRGIPQHSKNFQPQDIPQISETLPWGPLYWPNTQTTIEPYLSPGVEPNHMSSIYGIVLDSYSNQSYSDRPFRSEIPPEETDDREPWYNHPAPQTIPASSYKEVIGDESNITQGYLSPGPNSSNNFWSPWPKYYAYKSGDPIPVLTQGITTARIGAAYNIALTNYGSSNAVSATSTQWVPVQCIPLFQGERIEAGSIIYAAVKGQTFTPGPTINPDDPQYVEGSDATDTFVIQTGTLGQTPWDLNNDPTWGNIGWAGTPGLSFRNIPDSSTEIIETLQSPTNIEYLNQSNQGSIIVQGVTSLSPYPGLGNIYTSEDEETTEQELWQIQKNRFAITGVSGRATLSQIVPEKAQPIGVLLETIVGTGKWIYDGLPVVAPLDLTVEQQIGGANYVINVPAAVPTRSFDGNTGLTVNWTEFDATVPKLGGITGTVSVVAPGVGYTDGEYIVIQDDSLDYFPNTQYKGNNATYIYDTVGSLLTATGVGYYDIDITDEDRVFFNTINLTQNNAYISFIDDAAGGLIHDSGASLKAPVSEYPQDFSRYDEYTIFRVINSSGKYYDSALFQVSQLADGVAELVEVFAGKNYPSTGGVYQFFETEVVNIDTRSPVVQPTIGNTTEVSSIEVIDYGAGNVTGDQILLVESNYYNHPSSTIGNNCIYQQIIDIPPGYQAMVTGCPWYSPDGFINAVCITDALPDIEMNVFLDQREFQLKNNAVPCWALPSSSLNLPVDFNVYRIFYDTDLPGGASAIAQPMYVGYSQTAIGKDEDFFMTVGGTRYSKSLSLNTFNMTANTLRVPLEIVDGLISASNVSFSIDDAFYNFNTDSYTDNVTEFRIVSNVVAKEDQTVFRYTTRTGNIVDIEYISGIANYQLADGIYYFQTERTDVIPPTVDIETNPIDTTSPLLEYNFGQIRRIKLSTAGTNNNEGDIMVVLQDGSDTNAFFQYNNNMPFINLPPYAYKNGFNVDSSLDAWNQYNDMMETATNLMDKEVLVEIRKSQGNYMDTVLPAAQQFTTYMPPNENIYQAFY